MFRYCQCNTYNYVFGLYAFDLQLPLDGTPNVETCKTGKSVPYRPKVPRGLNEISQISWQRHRMVVRLSALRTGRLYPSKCSWYSFLLEAESTPGP